MERYTEYIEILPYFKVSELCLKTQPCHHYVKLKDKDELWNSNKIYNFCKEKNVDNIPNHFIHI